MFICHVQCAFYARNIFWILKIYRRGDASMCCCGQNIPIIGKPCSHASSFLRPCYAIGVFFGCFLRLMTWGKRRFSNRSTPDNARIRPTRSCWLFLYFYGSTPQLLTTPFRDFFDAVYRGFWTAPASPARCGA